MSLHQHCYMQHIQDCFQSVAESYAFQPFHIPCLECQSHGSNSHQQQGRGNESSSPKKSPSSQSTNSPTSLKQLRKEMLIKSNLTLMTTNSSLQDDSVLNPAIFSLSKDPTNSLIQWVVENENQLRKPMKVYSTGQEYWTRDGKQKNGAFNNKQCGSIRTQCTMDLIGLKSVTAEAELICALCDFLKRILHEDEQSPKKRTRKPKFTVRINNRAFLQLIIDNHNFEQHSPGESKESVSKKIFSILSKLKTHDLEDVKGRLLALSLNDTGMVSILNILSVKSLDALADIIGREHSSVQKMIQLFELIDAYGYSEYVQFDPKITRGLEYYSGIVFEAFDSKGQLLAGGGRYDIMALHQGASQHTAAVGFGVDLQSFIQKQSALLKRKFSPQTQDVVVPVREKNRLEAISLLSFLRKNNRKADMILKENQALAKSFSYASRYNAERVILVSGKEEGYRVKQIDGREYILTREQLLDFECPEKDAIENSLLSLQEYLVSNKNADNVSQLNNRIQSFFSDLKGQKSAELQEAAQKFSKRLRNVEDGITWNEETMTFDKKPSHRLLVSSVRNYLFDYSSCRFGNSAKQSE